MSLFRIHAYEVVPQRTKDTEIAPTGGSLPAANVEFGRSLEGLYTTSGLDRQNVVDFRVSVHRPKGSTKFVIS